SGLVVSFLVLVIGRFWRGVVEPWFEERVYKDLHLEGKWFSLYLESEDYRQEIINLKRHGHAVTGTMICKNSADEGEEYSLSGSFRNLILPMTYESVYKSKSDRGTITLKSSHNGQQLIGKIAMYETRRDSIGTTQVIWFRDKAELERTVNYIKNNREKIRELIRKENENHEELSGLMANFTKRKSQKQEEKDSAIDGEASSIEHKKELQQTSQ
ncbi:hypothetical protein, partial [Psychrobacter aquimaris]|uniref:hypothetical protein n=1 Tax=Psychrobacter aquimaris TaxID=292733 RepID=UPI003FD481AA